MIKLSQIDDNLECPFCRENGFDLIGLKNHLIRYCDEFNNLDISSCKGFFS